MLIRRKRFNRLLKIDMLIVIQVEKLDRIGVSVVCRAGRY